ncbi:Histidine kinase-like ATPase domain-containing protein [Lentzea xinjiangensis]|uniref:Histidine kinase-like ATPase domain-containing protein n=1 Tax=Lentzea xinjiangensis TaxID=402600 RepID=A0A1H9QTB1_9PSEU|nr:anti-sigma factor RsbA family regulatory protein [Lentzea xinjiangensis]SER63841.1 Histidine kinase-like ATPase domain-containing protein [Lentzea xinjiangensis]
MNSAAPFAHEALFYRDEDEFLTGTAEFVAEGVQNGEPVLVAVRERSIGLLRARLGAHADQVHFIDMTEAGRNPGRIIPGVLMAFSASTEHRFRVVGEPVWPGRTELEYPACVQHEALINTAFEGRRGVVLCPYDAGTLPGHVLENARRTHPVVIEGGRRLPSERYTDPSGLAHIYNVPLPPPPATAEEHSFSVSTLAHMRRVVAAYAHWLRREQVEDLVLAVNELATNSILHASGRGVLRLWREGNTVVAEVSDSGKGFPPSFTGLSGFGIVMVNLLCDLVRTHTSHTGTTVRVYLGR